MPKECLECRIIFPENLIQPMFTSHGNTFCCPICALEIRNQMTGLNDTKFKGQEANRLLKRARKFVGGLK